VYDIEDPEELLGILSKEFIKKGLETAQEESNWLLEQVKDETYDADAADALFQYFVMNEIVFG